MRTSRAQVAAIDAVECPGVHALSITELRAERDKLTEALQPPTGLGRHDPAKRLIVRNRPNRHQGRRRAAGRGG